MERLADRMRARIAQTFVGRDAELALMDQSFASDPPSVPIFLVHGPGGVGKSCLLERARALAAAHGIDSVRIDAREVEPTVAGLERALSRALDGAFGRALDGALHRVPGAADGDADPKHVVGPGGLKPLRQLLVIDSFEHLAHLAGWLRECFLAELPPTLRVLIATRAAPDAVWRTDPLWREATRTFGLRNLADSECARYLDARAIPAAHHEAIMRLSHGHPLALTLVADVVASTGEVPRQLGHDVVRQLAARFTAQAPSESHRRALEVCAHARLTTEPLLAESVDAARARELFEWLASLSFVESAATGLFPHDLVRDAIDDELCWRHPDRYRDVHVAVRTHLIGRARDAAQATDPTFDIIYTHRRSPSMQPFIDFRALGSVYFERGTAADLALLAPILSAEVSPAQRASIAHWWVHRACAVWVVRPGAGQLVGATLSIDLAALDGAQRDTDPVMAAVWRALHDVAAPRPGDRQVLARWSLAAGGQTRPSAAMNGVQMSQFHQWLTSPDLGTFVICTDHPDHWLAMMRHIGFTRLPSCDHVVDGVPVGCYAHDWRACPQTRWLEIMADRSLGHERTMDDPAAVAAAARLARPEFDRAVRDALRLLHDRTALASNPLTASSIVAADRRDAESAGDTLRRLLIDTAATLKDRPRDLKFWRALDATYLHPTGSQELAAEKLGLPFGTYRYQLATGIEHVAQAFWERETR